MLPLTYILTKEYGLIGPAVANLISISIYNIIRIVFLWKKFRLFPFTIQSIYTILLAGAVYTICYFLFRDVTGFMGLVVRSAAFILLFGIGVVYMKLSPDILPVIQSIRNRLRKRN
jgi:hypothetical protein